MKGFLAATRNAQHAATWLGAGDEISARIKSKYAHVRFIAPVKQSTLTAGVHGENLTLIASGDVESAVGGKGKVPDIFCLGIEEHRFFAGGRDAINLSVRRSAHIKIALRVESNGLCGKIRRFKDRGGLSHSIEAENFCGRTSGGVKHAFRVGAQRPQVGCISIRDQGELWSQLEAAIAAHCYAMGGTL